MGKTINGTNQIPPFVKVVGLPTGAQKPLLWVPGKTEGACFFNPPVSPLLERGFPSSGAFSGAVLN